jgi:MFS family permease
MDMAEETEPFSQEENILVTGSPVVDLTVDVELPEVITLPEAEPEGPPRLGPDFVRLWLATGISNLGDGARLTALPLLAATITRDPVAISILLFATRLPWLLFSLHAGAIADRIDRRRLIVVVSSVRAVVIGLLAIAALTDSVSLPLLYAVALAQGIGEVFSDNAAFALMPTIVPRPRIEEANGRLETAVIIANEFAGPALGGLLFTVAVALPFSLDAVSFLFSAALIASIAPRPSTHGLEKRTTSIGTDIREGLRWMWSHPVLRNLSLIAAATNLVLFATFSIQVLYVLEILELHAPGFGLFLTAEALGAIAGSMMAARLRRRFGLTRSVIAALLLAASANLVIGITSSWALAGVMAMTVSAGGGIWNVITNSFRQTAVPDHLMGRVQSSHRVLSWGAMPLGTILGGVLSAAFGLRAPFLVAGITLTLLAVAVGAVISRDASEPSV